MILRMVFLSGVVLGSSAWADPNSDEALLEALLHEFMAGASVSDASMHDRFWAEELVYTSSNGARFGKAEIMQGLNAEDTGESTDTRYSAEEIDIRVYGDTAVVAFRLVGAQGDDVSEYFNTGTFRRISGQWQAVAWQATRIEPETSLLAEADITVGPEAQPNPLEGLDSWDINENYIGLSVADQAWTINDEFTGIRAFLKGNYSFHESKLDREISDCKCNPPPPAPYKMLGTVFGEAQVADGDVEKGYLGVTAFSLQRNFELVPGKMKPLRDTLELGVVLHGMDDPLGVDSYTEITLARAGRTWGWAPRGKPYLFMAGLGLSGGYAWAESIAPEYNDVSNPIIGTWVTLGISRPGWGKAYVEQRQINGFSFSSPSAGGSTSREARFRFGLIKKLPSCYSAELYIDKRSFNFSDHRLSDLYSKARRTGLEIGCSW